MNHRFLCATLLPLCVVLLGQETAKNSEHDKEWAERRAHYLPDPIIELRDSELEITADSPRPLDEILTTLAKQNGWHVNYEDPVYGNEDAIDSTAPSWLAEHPDGPQAYAVARGAFHTKIQIDGKLRDHSMQVLSALIDDYNHSENPGRFELHNASDQLDVIPTGTASSRQVPLLDTEMSFEGPGTETAYATIERFCNELSRQSNHKVSFSAPPSANVLHQTHIKLSSQKQSAREILRQLCGQIGSNYSWRLLYDLDVKQFILVLEW